MSAPAIPARLRRSRYISWFGHMGAVYLFHDLFGYIMEMSPDIAEMPPPIGVKTSPMMMAHPRPMISARSKWAALRGGIPMRRTGRAAGISRRPAGNAAGDAPCVPRRPSPGNDQACRSMQPVNFGLFFSSADVGRFTSVPYEPPL